MGYILLSCAQDGQHCIGVSIPPMDCVVGLELAEISSSTPTLASHLRISGTPSPRAMV